MDEREELQALRRLAELEAKAGTPDPARVKRKADADAYAGEDVAQMGAVMRGIGGAKASWDKGALGLKGLFTDLSPEDKQLLEQGKAFDAESGFAGGVGSLAGDVAMTAAPAMRGMQAAQWAGRGLKALPKVGAVLGAIGNPLVAAGVGGAGAGALTAPEDRSGGALRGGVGGAVGEGGARVLTKALGGIGSSAIGKEAKELMDEGVNLPFWKAIEPGPVRNLAERAKALPFVGPLMKTQEAAAIRDYNKTLIRDATPPLPVFDEARGVLTWKQPRVKGVGQEGMRELGERFHKAYDAVYKGRTVPLDDAFTAEIQGVAHEATNYTPGIAADVSGAIKRMNDTLRAGTETTRSASQILDANGRPFVNEQLGHAGVSPANFKRALSDLDSAVGDAWRKGDGEKAKALELVRDAVADLRTRGLPPEVQSMLEPVNKAYGNFKLLQRASGSLGAVRNEGIVTPLQMTNAVKAMDKTPGKSATAQGTARGQQEAQRAQRVMGSELPEVGPGTAEKMALMSGLAGLGWAAPATLAGSAFLTRPGQRLLLGGYGWQDSVRGGTDRIADVMRSAGIAANN
jgi:hypothetical protein